MAFNTSFRDLMPTTATYSNVASRDVYGNRTAGTAVSFKCHLSLTRKETQDADGTVISVAGTLQMDGVYDIQKGAILTLPDGSTPKITAVHTYYDEEGPNHTSVEFEG